MEVSDQTEIKAFRLQAFHALVLLLSQTLSIRSLTKGQVSKRSELLLEFPDRVGDITKLANKNRYYQSDH